MNVTLTRGWLAVVGSTLLVAAVVAADITLRNGSRLIIDSSARIVDEEGDWTLSAEQLRSAVLDPITADDLSGVAGATGLQILAATNQAQAQSVIGASGSAQMLFATADPPASPPSATNIGAIAFSTSGRQYLWSTNTQGWDFFAARGALPDAGTSYSFLTRPVNLAGQGIGAGWYAPFWTMAADGSGAYATNAGTDILAPSGQFTGETDGWAAKGGNTVASTGNALTVSYVNDANGAEFRWQSSSTNLTEAASTNYFYRVAFDAYRTGGSAGDVELYMSYPASMGLSGLSGTVALPVTNNWYEMFLKPVKPADNIWMRFAGMNSGSVITLDNLRIEKMTQRDMLAVSRTTNGGPACVRGAFTLGSGYQGLFSRANAQVDPTSFVAVIAAPRFQSSPQAVEVYEVASSVWVMKTNIAYPIVTPGYDVTLEIASTSTAYEVRVDGHLRYTGTVPSGTEAYAYHGMVHTGGSGRATGWSLSTPTEATAQQCPVFVLGGSLSSGSLSQAHYAIGKVLRENAGRRVIPAWSAYNGYFMGQHLPAYEQMRRLYGQPSAVLLDLVRNHADDATGREYHEGMHRHVRSTTTNAAAILSWYAPYWGYSGGLFTTNQTDFSRMSVATNLASYYGHRLIDMFQPQWDIVTNLVFGASVNAILDIWYDGTDGLHPNTSAGQPYWASLMAPHLTADWVRGVHAQPATVAVQYSGADYWEASRPVWTAAVGDATATWTGSWSTGTSTAWTFVNPSITMSARQSSTVGDTVAITYTGRGLVLMWPRDATTMEYKVGAGSYVSITTASSAVGNLVPLGSGGLNGLESTVATRTVTIRVTSGTAKMLGWWTM